MGTKIVGSSEKTLLFYNCTRLDFEEKSQKNAENTISEQVSTLKTLSGYGIPQTPENGHAFGARNTCLACSEGLARAPIKQLL